MHPYMAVWIWTQAMQKIWQDSLFGRADPAPLETARKHDDARCTNVLDMALYRQKFSVEADLPACINAGLLRLRAA